MYLLNRYSNVVSIILKSI